MWVIVLFLAIALLVPTMAILVDSPIGRAIARRLEGPQATPPALADLAKKVDLLEAEVDDLVRMVQSLQDDNTFLQQLLADSPPRSTLPPPSGL